MDTYDSLGIVRNECQTVLHAMEARLATIGQLIFDIKVILLAEFLPIVLLCLGQHEDNLQGRGVLAETLDGTHQNRSPTYGQELLRNIASHPQAFTACNYNYIVCHFFTRLKDVGAVLSHFSFVQVTVSQPPMVSGGVHQ